MQNTTTYDLRSLMPAQRHQLAFQAFDALAAGEAFELINDHEPRGLLMQFAEQRPNAFDWQVMQAAPGAWRIRIARIDRTAGDGFAPSVEAGVDQGCCSCSCSGRG